ncbi:MAG: efflux RND transporter periplasmic adaptor subunit [Bauldia sp.]|nr:efflux RND transporter periplasmic adaptor subunit [Bauldia sp.]
MTKIPRSVPLLAGLLFLAGCEASTSPVEAPPRPVRIQSVVFEDAATHRDFVGVVAPRTETDLAFRVAGKMQERLVDVGDRVKAGDVIARLDAEDLDLQLQSAEAEFAAAKSNLAQSAADLDRLETLKAKGHATAADADRQALVRDEAKARLERAERALDLARRQLGYAELKADADGVITATAAEPGQVVAVGQAVATLAHLGAMEVVVALPEDWLARVRDAGATVSLWSHPGKEFPAKLRELSPEADAATRTYAARFTIEDADDTVAFGMTATVTLAHGGGAPVAHLPLAAVLNKGGGPSVYVVDSGDKLALKPVVVAAFTEDSALVTAGVEEGDRVVTLGVQKLEPGEVVRTTALR